MAPGTTLTLNSPLESEGSYSTSNPPSHIEVLNSSGAVVAFGNTGSATLQGWSAYLQKSVPNATGQMSIAVPASATPGQGYRVRVRRPGIIVFPSGEQIYTIYLSPPFDVVDSQTDLTATATSYNRVQLAWLDNETGETGRRIERSNDAGVTWREIAFVEPNITSFQDNNGLNLNTSYQYRVQATRPTTTATHTNVATVTTPIYDNSVTGNAYLYKIDMYPRVIKSGSAGTGTVTLSKPSASDTVITLNSNKTAFVLPNPKTVTIPAGKLSATFPVQVVGTVTDNVFAYISAKAGDWAQATVATAIPQTPSYTLEDLQIRSGNKSVSLHWERLDFGLCRKLRLYRRLQGQSDPIGKEVAAVEESSVVADADATLVNGTQYEYRLGVQEWNGTIASWSPWTTATPTINAPTVQLESYSSTWNGFVTFYLRENEIGKAGDYQIILDGKPYASGRFADTTSELLGGDRDNRHIFSFKTDNIKPGQHTMQIVAGDGIFCVATPPTTVNVANKVNFGSDDWYFVPSRGEYTVFTASSSVKASEWHLEITKDGQTTPVLIRTGSPSEQFNFSWDGSAQSAGSYTAKLTATLPGENGQGNQTVTKLRKITMASDVCDGLIVISRHNQTSAGNFDPTGSATKPDGKPFDADEVLGATVANALRARGGSGYQAVVLLAPEDQEPDWQELGVDYDGLKKWISEDAIDFYASAHGIESYFDNVTPSGRLKFRWGKKWFASNTEGYTGSTARARKNKDYIYVNALTEDRLNRGEPFPYRLVFVDTCFSAGGITDPDDANYGKPVENESQVNKTWAEAFGIDIAGTQIENCFFGWNGFAGGSVWRVYQPLEVANVTEWFGFTGYWYDWRIKFWERMGQGDFVTNAHVGPFPPLSPPVGAFGQANSINSPSSGPRKKQGFSPTDPKRAVIFGNVQL
ncbi:MAG: fibronectin type III domain-containing protein [Fibrella sp.]|nr:fibronectin type III domain-containing protein [Armatimonadota bacterium]